MQSDRNFLADKNNINLGRKIEESFNLVLLAQFYVLPYFMLNFIFIVLKV